MLYGSSDVFSLKDFLEQKPWWVWVFIAILVVSGLGFSCFGVYQLVSTNDQEIVSSNDVESQVCEQTADFGQVTVYISGAVVNPGVYVLESGDRVVDLLETAGGISSFADKAYVNREFNLAKQLNDGDQLYIPTKDEVERDLEVEFDTANADSQETSNGIIANYLISINSSTKKELQQLSGIGEVRASKIIENRPYATKQELVEKGVISQSLLDNILNEISI